ncbi:hypothetical protein DNTS_006228 [Danionella cerebrum]|uniref:Parathyroid hormone-related protein n=1 Tax=Danionella cerebrum TaxID=2873325 RepID=A0A553QD58_9TELE|nr:hypothetical protein DNTS_006228 [Danionella translucida]
MFPGPQQFLQNPEAAKGHQHTLLMLTTPVSFSSMHLRQKPEIPSAGWNKASIIHWLLNEANPHAFKCSLSSNRPLFLQRHRVNRTFLEKTILPDKPNINKCRVRGKSTEQRRGKHSFCILSDLLREPQHLLYPGTALKHEIGQFSGVGLVWPDMSVNKNGPILSCATLLATELSSASLQKRGSFRRKNENKLWIWMATITVLTSIFRVRPQAYSCSTQCRRQPERVSEMIEMRRRVSESSGALPNERHRDFRTQSCSAVELGCLPYQDVKHPEARFRTAFVDPPVCERDATSVSEKAAELWDEDRASVDTGRLRGKTDRLADASSDRQPTRTQPLQLNTAVCLKEKEREGDMQTTQTASRLISGAQLHLILPQSSKAHRKPVKNETWDVFNDESGQQELKGEHRHQEEGSESGPKEQKELRLENQKKGRVSWLQKLSLEPEEFINGPILRRKQLEANEESWIKARGSRSPDRSMILLQRYIHQQANSKIEILETVWSKSLSGPFPPVPSLSLSLTCGLLSNLPITRSDSSSAGRNAEGKLDLCSGLHSLIAFFVFFIAVWKLRGVLTQKRSRDFIVSTLHFSPVAHRSSQDEDLVLKTGFPEVFFCFVLTVFSCPPPRPARRCPRQQDGPGKGSILLFGWKMKRSLTHRGACIAHPPAALIKARQSCCYLQMRAGLFCGSCSRKRSVTHAQLMHDKGRTLQDYKRRLWLQELLHEVHTAEIREPHQPRGGLSSGGGGSHTASMPIDEGVAIATGSTQPKPSGGTKNLPDSFGVEDEEGTNLPQETNKSQMYKDGTTKAIGKRKKKGRLGKRREGEKRKRRARSVDQQGALH